VADVVAKRGPKRKLSRNRAELFESSLLPICGRFWGFAIYFCRSPPRLVSAGDFDFGGRARDEHAAFPPEESKVPVA
jgi:hypothetical protein